MATNKKGFILYCDLIHVFEQLTDSEAGELIKHVLRYVNDQNPNTENRLINLMFEPIKLQLKRDLKRWELITEKRKLAGSLGGKQKVANVANATKRKQKVANVAVTVNDTVNVTDTVINNYRQFAHLKISNKEITNLLDQGYLMKDIDEVLDAIQNYRKNINYKSLFLTAKKWLEKDKSLKAPAIGEEPKTTTKW